MIKIVLLRHGESVWNKENRFTGWTDVELSPKGIEEAMLAGLCLKKNNYKFDLAVTSFLKRASDTLKIVLDELELNNMPIISSWKMNERHYGALQGLNKAETAKVYGEEQVHLWRRDPNARPPELDKNDPRYPGNDIKYKDLTTKELPLTENLDDTKRRVINYWKEYIVPEIKEDKHIIIVAHGNSLRALIDYLDDLSDAEVTDLNIPTGIPLVYELDTNLKPIKHYYLEVK